MSEVAAVAAITGGASVLTSAVTAGVTWGVSKNSSSIERAKLEAENHRLQRANREDERRNRQSTYHQFIDVLILLFQILGTETSLERRKEICSSYNHLFAGVILFSPPSVREGALAINTTYRSIWPALAAERENNPQKAYPEQWRDATAGLGTEFSERFSELVTLMHADVTHGIANDPEG